MAEKTEKRERYQATGNPLDLTTDPTVPKLFAAIQAAPTASQLTAMDRAVMDFLLAVAYPDLESKTLHEVSLADLWAVLGSKHESSDRLVASLSRLSSTQLRIPVQGNGQDRIIITNLVNASVPKRSGMVRFGFYEELRPMLADPAVFARLRLAVIAQFRSKYATPLYEMFEQYANRRIPRWEVSVDDLRAFLTVGASMPNWADFWRRVLAPALKEINDLSGLSIAAPTLEKQGKKVVSLVFDVKKKDAREATDAELRHKAVKELRQRRPRDPNTPDLLDQRTDTERGGPAMVTMKVIEEARRRFPGWDIEHFEQKWREFQADRTPPRDPDKAFLGWLTRELTNKRLPS